ncbi:LysR family transcriptional regulator [Crenobacter sp. SG2303]|uniref:LysR family transcriptional regulator n=1 Tax=Crenobacter oryzisoli TaxID=3056844 RepID=A0ABT7XPC2_9NEIS|nr:LysR family transcriptional regulator [Crenobacter sp. SG2303]MDN0075642.1 LysR family transcriptional regulator [Crenobacter sp. SG2303]
MQWEGIVEFVAVVEAQSFTGAAQRLGLSVAQVSRQVSALEQRLATRLLYRTTRRVSVTEAGQLYYRHCRPLLDGLQEAEQALSYSQDKPAGHLRLTAPVYYGETVVAPLLHRYLLDFPAVTAELNLDNRKIDLVADGYDLGIRLGPMDESSLMVKRLGSRTHYVCASPDYLERHGEPHTLAELSQHQCLVGTIAVWRFSEGGALREIHVGGRLRCNSGAALLDAALNGLGLVQLPDYYVADALESGRLTGVLTAYTLQDGIWATYPRSRYIPPKVSRLVDYLERAMTLMQKSTPSGCPVVP